MNKRVGVYAVTIFFFVIAGIAQNKTAKPAGGLSFKGDVLPIINAKCMPCHSEDNFNPSELSLDSYELFAQGGKHGAPFKPGKSSESLVIKKISDTPPFGDRMPLNSKKKIQEGRAVWLTPDEIKTIATWIDQGAKNN